MAHARAGGLVSYTTASHTGCCRACNSQSTHSPLSWACGREHRQASGGERESSWSPGGTSGAPRVSPAPSQESAGPLLGRRRVRESVTESSWPPRGTSRAPRVSLAPSRYSASEPGPLSHARSWGLVSNTRACQTLGCRAFNPQSTHSQLTVNSTVNSQSTQQSTQRSTGQPNPGFTLRNCRRGVVIRPDKEEGCGDRPLLIILIKLKEFSGGPGGRCFPKFVM